MPSSTSFSVGLAPVSRRTSFHVPLMISFLQVSQLIRCAGIVFSAFLVLVLGRSARWLLTLTENLLEVSDFGKIHVSRRAPSLSVRTDVLAPEEIGYELVGDSTKRFEFKQMLRVDLTMAAVSALSTISWLSPSARL